MTPGMHEEIAALLALSAAGLLDAAQERRVREHVRECGACAARLGELGGVAQALRSLPAEGPSPELVLQTQARVAAEMALAADRRRSGVLALAGAVSGWVSWLAIWSLYRALTGGVSAIVQFDRSGAAVSAAISVIMALLAAPIAAAVQSARRRTERRLV